MSHESGKRVLKFRQVLTCAKYVSILADEKDGSNHGFT